MNPEEKAAVFVPRLREVLGRISTESLMAILGAAAHRRYSSGPPVRPQAGPVTEGHDGPPLESDRNPELEALAYDAESQLVAFAGTLPADEAKTFFRSIEDVATEILKERGYSVALVPHH